MKRPISKTIPGTQYIGKWKNTVIPIYDVLDNHGLNSIIGYVKHLNNEGVVLYRGQCSLYKSLIPSIMHNKSETSKYERMLEESLNALYKDPDINKSMDWNKDISGWELYIKTAYEAALQHYGAKTYCVDFVDNHWTALWFALNKYDSKSGKYIKRMGLEKADNTWIERDPYYPTISQNKYSKVVQDIISKYESLTLEEFCERVEANNVRSEDKVDVDKLIAACERKEQIQEEIRKREEKTVAYLFLFFAETSVPEVRGLYLGSNTYTVDLRKALPGYFLRPISQHGWVVKGKTNDYDYTKNVLCVLRINTELINNLIGEGVLLSQDNFFPNPEVDGGYRLLLRRQMNNDYFNKKYAYLLPEGMIKV